MAININDFFRPGEGEDLFSLHGFMDETQATVQNMLEVAHAKADSALEAARDAIEVLKEGHFPEVLPEPSPVPTITTTFGGAVLLPGYLPAPPNLGAIAQGVGADLTLDDIVIPDVTGTIPTYVPLITGLSFVDPPPLVLPTVPQAPVVSFDFDTPDAPVATYGDIPDLTGVTIPAFTPPTLALFNEPAPQFTGQVPDPFVGWAEPVYTSVFGTRVTDTLTTMMDGGTGLTADVERAIWERARGREDVLAVKALREADSEWASRGYTLPPGELRAAVIATLDASNAKVSTLGRDIAIAQADLEQKNRQFAVEKGIAYEGLLINIFIAVTDRSFQLAKFAVESQIQIFQAQVAAFNVEQTIFAQRIEVYKVGLQYALAQIESFKAQIDAQRLIAEVDNQLIAAYVAKINAFKAQVDAYTGLVQAAVARANVERGKIDLFKGQIDGYVATVGGKKTEFDAYIARIGGEAKKADLEVANAQVFKSRVEAIGKINEVYFKRSEVQIENNKLRTQYAVQELDRLRTISGQQLNAVQAGASMFEATTRRAAAEGTYQTEVKRLEITTQIEAARNVVARYTASVANYQARVQHIIEIARINASSLQAVGQITSNLAAGAMAGTSVGAQIASSGSASENKQASATKSAAVSDSNTASNNYSVQHNYNHEE
mgnify:CR=1 FL=1